MPSNSPWFTFADHNVIPITVTLHLHPLVAAAGAIQALHLQPSRCWQTWVQHSLQCLVCPVNRLYFTAVCICAMHGLVLLHSSVPSVCNVSCGAAAALTERERSCSLGLTVTHTADSPQVSSSFYFFPPHALSSYLFPSRSPWFDALGNNKRPIAILLSPPISQKPTTSPWSSPLLPFLSYSLSSLVSTCLLKPRRLSTCRPLSHDFQAHHFLFLTAAALAIASVQLFQPWSASSPQSRCTLKKCSTVVLIFGACNLIYMRSGFGRHFIWDIKDMLNQVIGTFACYPDGMLS